MPVVFPAHSGLYPTMHVGIFPCRPKLHFNHGVLLWPAIALCDMFRDCWLLLIRHLRSLARPARSSSRAPTTVSSSTMPTTALQAGRPCLLAVLLAYHNTTFVWMHYDLLPEGHVLCHVLL